MFKPSEEKLGVALALLAAFGFAAKTVLAKLAYRHGVDPATILALRMGCAGLFFGSALAVNLVRGRWSPRLSPRRWLQVAALAFFGYYLSPLLDFSGLRFVDAALGRMILFIYPTLVLLLNALLRRRPLPPRLWAALALSYGGLALMASPGLRNAEFRLGGLLIFGGAVSFAFYLVGLERLLKIVDAAFLTSLVLSLSCLGVMAHFFLTRPASALAEIPPPALGYGLIMGLFSTVLPIYAMNAGVRRLGADRTVLMGLLGPVMTFGLGYFLLDERLTWLQLAGLGLILFGVSRSKSF